MSGGQLTRERTFRSQREKLNFFEFDFWKQPQQNERQQIIENLCTKPQAMHSHCLSFGRLVHPGTSLSVAVRPRENPYGGFSLADARWRGPLPARVRVGCPASRRSYARQICNLLSLVGAEAPPSSARSTLTRGSCFNNKCPSTQEFCS